MKTLLDKTAYIISGLTSPFIVITVIGLFAIRYYAASLDDLVTWGGTFALFSILIPFFFIYHGVKTGKFSDIHIMVREQRTGPFLVSIGGGVLILIAFHFEKAPLPLIIMATVLLANALIFFLITRFWKISIHSASLASSITITAVLIDPHMATLFLISPLAIWARIYRHRHNFWQGASAAFLAVSISLIIFKLFRII